MTKGFSGARQAILEALDSVEEENHSLKDANKQLRESIDKLELENEMLRNEIKQLHEQKQQFITLSESLERDASQLKSELVTNKYNIEKERKINENLQTKLQTEAERYNQQIESMKTSFSQRNHEFRRLQQELEYWTSKVDRKNYNEIEIELLNEIEALKNERKELITVKDEADRKVSKLKEDLAVLHTQFQVKESDLRNEQRRHSVLTKEFNSLLDENNRLKLRMRRTGSLANLASSTRESIPSNTPLPVSRNSSSASSGKARSDQDTEVSIIINNTVYQPPKPQDLARENTMHSLRDFAKSGIGTQREANFTRGQNLSFLSRQAGGSNFRLRHRGATEVDENLPAAELPQIKKK